MHRRAVMLGMAAAAIPALAHAAAPETVAEIGGQLLLEGIAHDGRRLYLGGIASRSILTLDRGGRPTTLSPGPLLGVFGLASDARRGRLWAATAALDQPGRTELVQIDTAAGRVVHRFPPPAGHPSAAFGDVALGPNGDVFVSDSKGGTVLHLRNGATALEVLVPPGKLRSPQGMVVQSDRLILADYSTGLHQVDLGSGVLSAVPGATIRGIDGLVAWKGDLIAIQNGGTTPRVIRISLPAGEGPEAEILYEGGVLIEPTLGTVVGERLLFIGRSQWGEADANGVVKSAAGPTRVMSLALPA
jgi:hypothetical protein